MKNKESSLNTDNEKHNKKNDYLNQPEFSKPWTVPELGMEFMPVEPGSFEMGSDSSEVFGILHTVHITKPFWMGRYPVTQAEYEELTGENPSNFDGGRNPVDMVDWHDAVEFCRKLTEQERKADRLSEGWEYRLPTEAEWEYAARGGKQSFVFEYVGSDNIDGVAWYRNNSGGKTHSVGKLARNELGLYDMSGNVNEWCLDWSAYYYYEKTEGAKDPFNNVKEEYRVLRGGSWDGPAGFCRSAFRWEGSPSDSDSRNGFRVVLAPSISKLQEKGENACIGGRPR